MKLRKRRQPPASLHQILILLRKDGRRNRKIGIEFRRWTGFRRRSHDLLAQFGTAHLLQGFRLACFCGRIRLLDRSAEFLELLFRRFGAGPLGAAQTLGFQGNFAISGTVARPREIARLRNISIPAVQHEGRP